jgi:flagellar biosynthesis chaperone FliJ
MAPKFSLQNVMVVRPGKVELHQTELSKLLATRHETERRLVSLKEFQRDLLDQLRDAQYGEIDLSKVSLLRMNILQANNQIENISLELARLNRQIREKN